ncbi:cardiolipin synthase [Bacillaceae bacterium Marseille-Q3522]|nr:cardiolipin synthase [Bacillaceae bacterium Marseille-Q3522]
MYNEADLIAFGSYKNFDSSWNMARNPNDIKQEDANNYTEGRLYNFNIDEVLLGEAENQIKINLRYQESIDIEDANGKIHKIKNKVPLFLEPEIGANYIVFLKKDPFDNYYGAIEPFQILINQNETAELKTNLTDTNKKVTNTVQIENQNTKVMIEQDLPPITDTISGLSLKELKEKILGYQK